MIDEQKLIDILRTYYDRVLHQDISDDEKLAKHDMLSDVMVEIKRQPKVDEWISCSDQLPEEGQKVLATHEGGLNPERQVIEHVFKNGEFFGNWDMDMNFKSPTYGQRYMGKVIAWMPFPDVYRK